MAALPVVPELNVRPDRWHDMAYEDLVERPQEEVERLLAALRLPPDPQLRDVATVLDRTVTKAVTPPGRDKWRRENPAEVASVLQMLAPTMRRLGYDDGEVGDVGTGEVLRTGRAHPGRSTATAEPDP